MGHQVAQRVWLETLVLEESCQPVQQEHINRLWVNLHVLLVQRVSIVW
jgi:hypothetical protein